MSWRQNVQFKWARESDGNLKFFHKVNGRICRNAIKELGRSLVTLFGFLPVSISEGISISKGQIEA